MQSEIEFHICVAETVFTRFVGNVFFLFLFMGQPYQLFILSNYVIDVILVSITILILFSFS